MRFLKGTTFVLFLVGMRNSVTKICLLLSLTVIPVLIPATGFAAITAADLTRNRSTSAASSYTTGRTCRGGEEVEGMAGPCEWLGAA
jgi:hypothetical protein